MMMMMILQQIVGPT